MQKPDYAIRSEEWLDYGLSERVARHLEASPLHVYDAQVVSAVPAAIGDPDDPLTSIVVDFTLLTDGRRGWLVLVRAQDEWDAEVEMTELVEQLLEDVDSPPKVVVRAAEPFEPRDPSVLDLRDRSTVRARLEEEFARHFEGVSPCPVEPFLRPFEACGYGPRDELTIRRVMNQEE